MHLFRRIAVAVTAAAVIVWNILANALPLNGLNTGDISDRFDVFFVPAGYVFSIWGLIYSGWILYAVFQFLPSQLENKRVSSIAPLFFVNGAANVLWLLLWHYEVFVWTVPVMLVILATLILIDFKLRIPSGSTAETLCVDVPFGLYLGWISVATIANITAVLDFVGWNGWGIAPEAWTIVMLAAGVLLAWAMGIVRRNIAYILVIVWAFIGIAVKHDAVPLVSVPAWIGAGLAAAALIPAALKRKNSPAKA